MVTICLKERGGSRLGEIRAVSGQAQDGGGAGRFICEPTALGERVLACWRQIPRFWPEVSLIEAQLMPDHFHGILFVERPFSRASGRKTLGDVIRGFKTGCREVGWDEGFVDNILFREGQLRRMIDYLRNNPRRLAEKRANPGLFRVARDLRVCLAVSGQEQNRAIFGQARDYAHFMAIGNQALLARPVRIQVQCSRSDFAYKRQRLPSGGWKILRDSSGVPLVEFTSAAFEEKCADALAAVAHGAVLVSPCISAGEREIARRAHAAGAAVIALRNKGFAKYQKPEGQLFDQCAKGNLLLLAPAAWPYVPGDKPPTRESSLVLNRIAQLIAGEGAAAINYRGATIGDVDALVGLAVSGAARGNGGDGE